MRIHLGVNPMQTGLFALSAALLVSSAAPLQKTTPHRSKHPTEHPLINRGMPGEYPLSNIPKSYLVTGLFFDSQGMMFTDVSGKVVGTFLHPHLTLVQTPQSFGNHLFDSAILISAKVS